MTASAWEESLAFARREGEGQERALAVHGHVARAALDFFAPVKAVGLAFCRRFDALAVQDGVVSPLSWQGERILHACRGEGETSTYGSNRLFSKVRS